MEERLMQFKCQIILLSDTALWQCFASWTIIQIGSPGLVEYID